MNKNPVVARVVALVVIVIVAGAASVYALMNKKPSDATAAPVSDTTQTQAQATTTTQPESSQSAPATASLYKNGTYSATGSYISPGGNETIGVSVTLDNDVVTAVTVTPHPVNAEDGRFQTMFAAGISSLVVGKNISAVQVTHVSGSSLTSGGFNQAIAQIETEARA